MFRFLRRINANAALFSGNYVDVRMFYVLRFDAIPCITFIDDLDSTKIAAYVQENVDPITVATYHYSYFDYTEKKVCTNNAILVLQNRRMIEFGNNYCVLLHKSIHYEWAERFAADISQFRNEQAVASYYTHTHVVGFARETEMN